VDAGLQPERTFLAWTRTACSLAVVGLLGLRWAGGLGAALLLVAVLGAAGMLGLLATTRRRARRLGGALTGAGRGTPPAAAQVLGLTAVVAVLGLTCAVVVVLV